jgi:type IV pilus assembly protein PilC
MWLSDTARHYWWAGLAAVAAAVFAYYRLRLSAARRWFDVVKVSLPLFGPLNRKVAVARFVRTFGLLSQNGVSLMSALDVAEKVANNYLISLAAADIRHAVRGGGNFSGPMAAHTIFPSMVLQLASTGESTGRMPAMLLRAADHLDREIDRTIKRLLTVLEPLLTVVLAAVVGGVLMAVYLPMFDIMKMTQ